MAKKCPQCRQKKSVASFTQWYWYDTEGKRHSGPRMPTCTMCYKVLEATSLPADKQLKVQLMLRKNQRAIATELAADRCRQRSKKERAKKAAATRKERNRIERERKSAVERQKPENEQLQTTDDLLTNELMERQLARVSLIEFIKKFNPNYEAGWVHEDICRRLKKFLNAMEAGQSPRLMLFMPPRHGKSMIASHNFPAWALGLFPEYEIIAASYGSSLPNKFSRQVRAFLRDSKYKDLFPKTKLDPTNENVEGWSTTAGGGYIPAGVGGGITGKGAHIFIVDDPIKDAEEADSETIRQNIWDWWGSTAYTRLAPNAGVLVIQTRWHDDDLSGRMIMQMREEMREAGEIKDMNLEAGMDPAEVDERYEQMLLEIDQWEIIDYPAISTHDEYLNRDGTVTTKPIDENSKFLRYEDEALHPQRFDRTRLMKVKRTLQPRHWSALYQQNPVPDEGMFFTKNMLKFDTKPEFSRFPICMAWDLAVGQKQQNDFTVGVVGCLDYYDRLIVLEIVRAKMNIHQSAEAILGLYDKYNRMIVGNPVIGIEHGQLSLSMGPHLNKVMDEERLFPSFDDTLKPVSDKIMRAGPLQGRMQQGKVLFVKGENWNEDVQHELLRFPGGVHDDIVDALAWLARMFTNISAPKRTDRIVSTTESWRKKLILPSNIDPMGA